jgi:cytochrome c553
MRCWWPDSADTSRKKKPMRHAVHAALLLICAGVFTNSGGTVRAESRKVTIAACAMCHGEEGIARDGEVPNLAGQNERYLYNQILAFRSGARKHQEMRYMARELTLAEIADMAAYYAALPPR